MKKFKDLKIGDKLFLFDHKSKLYPQRDQYGNQYNSGKCNETVTVKSLLLSEKGLKINLTNSSSYSNSSDCRFLITELYSHIQIVDKDRSYERTIISDAEFAKSFIREHVLSAIKYEEEQAVKAKEESINRIQEIRKSYWDVLK